MVRLELTRGLAPQRSQRCAFAYFATSACGRDERTRTSGLTAPSRALYQTELHPVVAPVYRLEQVKSWFGVRGADLGVAQPLPWGWTVA